MATSPCGWYLPITSPTTRADFTYARSGRCPCSDIDQRMRRWTGLRPSRASGRAREWMTEYAYSRYESSTSVVSGLSMTRAPAWSNADGSTRLFSFLRRAMGNSDLSGVDRLFVDAARRLDQPVLPRLDPLAHQQLEGGLGALDVVQGDPPDGAGGRVHRGLPQLVGVHLAEALEPRHGFLHRLAAPLEAGHGRFHLLLGVREDGLRVTPLGDHLVQRRHGGEQPALLDHRSHVLREQGDQQGTDVRAVHVGVRHDHDAAVAERGELERAPGAGPQ